MRALQYLLLAMLGLCCGNASGQMPSQAEFEHAVAAARPDALRLGLQLRTDSLWLKLLQARTPMMASLSPDGCHVGYSAYNPRIDFGWLFPALHARDRAAWLGGLIRHELAHCADMRDAPFAAVATDQPSSRGSELHREVLADLAFALHVDEQSTRGGLLIERLAVLRAERRADDPSHDSSTVLRCYLAQRESLSPGLDDWLTTLRAWRTRCQPGERMVQPVSQL